MVSAIIRLSKQLRSAIEPPPRVMTTASNSAMFRNSAKADKRNLGRINHPENLLYALIPEIGDGQSTIGHFRAS